MNGRHRFSGKRTIQVLELNEGLCGVVILCVCDRSHMFVHLFFFFFSFIFFFWNVKYFLKSKTNPLSLMYSLSNGKGTQEEKMTSRRSLECISSSLFELLMD